MPPTSRGEGMTDSPTPEACPPAGHHLAMEHTPQPRPHHREQHHNHLRPQQRAPRGVDIKDRRPLRGRPFGPILDPDASPGAAQQQAKETVRKIHNKNNGLTGPAPSGMNPYYMVILREELVLPH